MLPGDRQIDPADGLLLRLGHPVAGGRILPKLAEQFWPLGVHIGEPGGFGDGQPGVVRIGNGVANVMARDCCLVPPRRPQAAPNNNRNDERNQAIFSGFLVKFADEDASLERRIASDMRNLGKRVITTGTGLAAPPRGNGLLNASAANDQLLTAIGFAPASRGRGHFIIRVTWSIRGGSHRGGVATLRGHRASRILRRPPKELRTAAPGPAHPGRTRSPPP